MLHTQAISGCGGQGLLSSCGVWVSHCSGFSYCRSRPLECEGFSSCGGRAQLPCGTWDLPRAGIESASLILTVRFLTTGSPGKPLIFYWRKNTDEQPDNSVLSLGSPKCVTWDDNHIEPQFPCVISKALSRIKP